MVDGSDGIAEAEHLIEKAGFNIKQGLILLGSTPKEFTFLLDQDFWDAVTFLCEEWDYSVE